MNNASVVQVNTSPGGMPKLPVAAARLTPLGLDGDGHRNPAVHGGPRQAVLIITSEGLEELKQSGFELGYGALGENLTTTGLDRRTVRIGQRYRVGDAVIEITKVRAPCANLNPYGASIHKAIYDGEVKAGNFASPRWGLSGFYASVVQPGTVRPGAPLVLLEEAV